MPPLPVRYPFLVSRLPIQATITQAFAETVVDDSRTGPAPPSMHHDMSELPDVGDIVGDNYRLVRLLGRGTFGRVFVAERVDVPEHRVALKLMPREVYAGRNVERELVMLAAAGHPNVVQLKDHGMTDRYVWLTMPVYEGQTLDDRLDRRTLTLKEAYEIFVPIARGVAALHAYGLRHQDLKPENIFLAEFAGRLHPIILDLGVAAECSSSFVAGTILFAAPEQIASLTSRDNRPPLSEKIDTYSLAATLLLSLVGPDSFPGQPAKTEEEIEEAQQERATEPLRPSALPDLTGPPRDKLSRAFRRWMALDPAERSSMAEMAEQLDVLLEQEREAEETEAARIVRQGMLLRRFRLVVAGLLVAALGLIGYGWTKRNTLRLANELARVRAEGAAQFDKLETCAASHRLAVDQVHDCNSLRVRDRTDFQANLERFKATGSAAQAECAEQMMTCTTRLRTCEDMSTAASRTCTSEKEQLVTEWTTRAGQLAAQADELKHAVEARTAEIDSLHTESDKLRGELRACQSRVAENPYVEPSASPPSHAAPAPSPRNPAPASSAASTPAPPAQSAGQATPPVAPPAPGPTPMTAPTAASSAI